MKRILVIVVLVLAGLALGKYIFSKQEQARIEEEATVLLNRVEDISKLMVVEGHFSEIYTYKKEENLFRFIPVEKKAIVVVNATAYVGYDLNQMEIAIDKERKKLIIGMWPKADVLIEPEVKYYDLQQSQFYNFDERDLTQINKRAIDLIESNVRTSNLEQQAKVRVEEVLESLIFASHSLGWEVEYEVPELKQLD